MQITAVLEGKCAITNPIGRHGVADVDTSIQYVSDQNNDDQGKEGPTPPPHYHSPFSWCLDTQRFLALSRSAPAVFPRGNPVAVVRQGRQEESDKFRGQLR